MKSTLVRLSLVCVAWFAVCGADLGTGCIRHVAADEFEERPEVLRPRTPRSEAVADRMQAAALYAHGRLLLLRDRPAEALRRFQRAWRYDRDAAPIAGDIVTLAMDAGRNDEAIRYAALDAANDQADPATSLRLASLAAEQRDWRRAALLYGQAARIHRLAGERDFTIVLLHLELGRLEFLLGRSKEAAAALDVVRQAFENPEKFGLNESLRALLLERPEQTYALMAEAFLDDGRLDAAEAMFGKLQESKKNEALHAFHLARVAAARRKFPEALQRLDECFAANLAEADRDPYELLADCLRQEFADPKELDARVAARLAPLQERFPENRSLAAYLAERYVRLGRVDDALKLYERLLTADADAELFGGWIDALRRGTDDRRLLAALARAAVALGTFDELEETIRPLAEDRPRVQRLAALARDGDRRRPEPERGAAEKPGAKEAAARIPGAAFAMALVATAAKDFDLVESLFEIAVTEDSPGKGVVLPLWAMNMVVDDQPARAAKVLRRLLDEKIRPESARAYYYHLIGSLESAGRTDEALAAGVEARNEGQASPLVEGRIAWVLYHAKRRPAAEEAYRRLLDDYDGDLADPPSRAAVREARLVLSHLAVLRDDRAAAEEYLEQVLDEYPEDVGALNDLAYLWSDRAQHLERALAMSRQVVEASPKNDAYRDTLGWVLYRLARYDAALVELRRAAAEEHPDGVILDHLGDCLHKLDRVEEARESWRRAVEALRKEGDEAKLRIVEGKLKSP